MLVTLSGMVILVRPVQAEKASSPMLITPVGITVFLQPHNNILPSFFTGEEYKDYSHPILDNNYNIIKICTCKKGFKDSIIKTFKFVRDSNETIVYEERKVDLKAKGDFVIRPEDHIDSGSLRFDAVQSSSSLGSPHGNTSRPGTSSYEPNYYNIEDNNEEEDEI